MFLGVKVRILVSQGEVQGSNVYSDLCIQNELYLALNSDPPLICSYLKRDNSSSFLLFINILLKTLLPKC